MPLDGMDGMTEPTAAEKRQGMVLLYRPVTARHNGECWLMPEHVLQYVDLEGEFGIDAGQARWARAKARWLLAMARAADRA